MVVIGLKKKILVGCVGKIAPNGLGIAEGGAKQATQYLHETF